MPRGSTKRRTQEDAGARKTQFGPGSNRGEQNRGNCDKWSDQTVKAFITDRRVSKLRSDRVTVAPQAWGKAGALGALRPMHPVFRVGIGGARLNPSTSSRSGKALVPPGRPSGERGSILPVRPLGGCSESEGSILCSRSRIRGTGTLQVSRHETLEKPETASIIAPVDGLMEDFRRGFGSTQRESLAPG